MLGHIYNVSASEGERFHLRLLLLYKKGCTSFESVQTSDPTVYNMYKEAAEAVHFIEW